MKRQHCNRDRDSLYRIVATDSEDIMTKCILETAEAVTSAMMTSNQALSSFSMLKDKLSALLNIHDISLRKN